METLFDSFGQKLPLSKVIKELRSFMAADPGRQYRIMIGSDSQLLPDGRADFVSALVIHRIGGGARYFWQRLFDKARHFHTLRERMYKEAMLSIDATTSFLSATRLLDGFNFKLEIHADVGVQGATREVLHEITGMIRAHHPGLEVLVKPESIAASHVADRHVRHYVA